MGSRKTRFFEIANPGMLGTPQAGSKVEKPFINFNGCDLANSHFYNGYWEVTYFVSCRNGDVSKFVAKIEWTGELKSRESDMSGILKVNIEEL